MLSRQGPASITSQKESPSGPDSDHDTPRCPLLEALPQHVLLDILRRLDPDSLGFLAQTCRTFLHLSGSPSLWPRRRLGGPLVRAVRFSLAGVLRVPPQMLHVRLEEGRSSKFPLSVPLHNLRFVLGAADVDALAERTSGLVQDLIASAPQAATYHPASAFVPVPGPASAAAAAERDDDDPLPPHPEPVGAAEHTGASAAAAAGGGGVAANSSLRYYRQCAGGSGTGSSDKINGGSRDVDDVDVGGGGSCPPRLRPSVALLMCRADRGFVRLGLRPGVAVARVLLAAPEFTRLPSHHHHYTAAVACVQHEAVTRRRPRGVAGEAAVASDFGGAGGEGAAWQRTGGWGLASAALTELILQGLMDELLALPYTCMQLSVIGSLDWGPYGSNGLGATDPPTVPRKSMSADAEAGGGGAGYVCPDTDTAATATAAGAIDGAGDGSAEDPAVAASVAAAEVVDGEAAQLELLEAALGGVPYACDAWRAFAAGCHRVAAARLRLVAAAAAASAIAAASLGGDATAGAPLPYPFPQPQSLLAVAEVEASAAGEGAAARPGGGGREAGNDGGGGAAAMGLEGHGCSGALAAGRRAAGPAQSRRVLQPQPHRYGLLTGSSLPSVLLVRPGSSTTGSSNSASSNSGGCSSGDAQLSSPSPAMTGIGYDPAALYGMCVSVRLRLLGLVASFSCKRNAACSSGGGGDGGAATAGHPSAAVPAVAATGAAPRTADVTHALEVSRSIALVFGRLMASVAAARKGFEREAAAAAVAASAGGAAGSAAEGAWFGIGVDDQRAAASAGRARGRAGPGSRLRSSQRPRAVAAVLDAACAAAANSDANLCLTTSEALLEVRAEILATAATACTKSTADAMAMAVDKDGSSSGGCLGRAAERRGPAVQHNDGSGGAAVAAPRRAAGASVAPTAAGDLVRKLLALLSGCLVPAAVRLLATPTRYSPLGVPQRDTDGDGGGALGPVAAAMRMGASLGRVAVIAAAAAAGAGGGGAVMDAEAEAREVLRGLLLSYLLREMTWALRCLGVL